MAVRFGWLTDIHLDFVTTAEQRHLFYAAMKQAAVDVWLVGGDVGEADTVGAFLHEMAVVVEKPVYFVLGNHDYYGSSVAALRAEIRALCAKVPNLHYLSAENAINLGTTTALVGHDGWADLQYGDFKRSSVWMRDYSLIEDLKGIKKAGLLPVMTKLADEAAEHFRRVLPSVLERTPQVLVLTHVPPFREACWHEGKISDYEWLPHFTCKAVGYVLLEMMQRYPQRNMMVLCGHTHGSGKVDILPNLRVLTGGAEYGDPKIQRIYTVP
jgi:3',5'-cyclic-AMP phosphodiesterase